VLAGRGRGWIGGGPKARARSRGPGCSFLFLSCFCFCFYAFVCSDGGERGGLTSWLRPGGGNPMYICHGRKAAVRNMKKQTNKKFVMSPPPRYDHHEQKTWPKTWQRTQHDWLKRTIWSVFWASQNTANSLITDLTIKNVNWKTKTHTQANRASPPRRCQARDHAKANRRFLSFPGAKSTQTYQSHRCDPRQPDVGPWHWSF
jgi:hypothetical protein